MYTQSQFSDKSLYIKLCLFYPHFDTLGARMASTCEKDPIYCRQLWDYRIPFQRDSVNTCTQKGYAGIVYYTILVEGS